MSKNGGRPVFKGMNTQAWAAMSLFLQHVERSDFRYIGFEGEKLEDFHLAFENGRKIICESKAYKISLAKIKEILNKIISHGQTTPQDEILVICEKVDDKTLKNLIELLPYYDKEMAQKVARDKNLTDKQLKLLPQVRFWEVSVDISRKTAELLMARLLKIWVPKHRLDEIVRDLLEKEVYQGSEKGTTLTKEDFLTKLEEKKRLMLEDTGYEKEKTNKEQELSSLVKELKNPKSSQWANNQLSVLSNSPDENYWIFNLLEREINLNLRDWDRLWKMGVQGAFVYEVFKVFKKNISNRDNRDYFVEFAPQIIEYNTNFFREDFIKTDIVDICKTIIENTHKHDGAIFELVKKLFEPSISKYFYTKHREDNRYEWEEISKFLVDLYKKTNSSKFREEIVKYIFTKFNLVEDEWKYWHYTPPPLFEIIRLHLESDPKKGILELIPILSNQFSVFYERFGKKLEFEGWEHMGGGIGQIGSDFSIHDKFFIGGILKQLIQKIYSEDKEKGWQFILKNCVSSNSDEVSIKKPDFLNRASIPVLFQEYKGVRYSDEAFKILSVFIRMRKGIPWKADLIYQAVREDKELTDKQKWVLVQVGLDEYKNLPVNVFVEQIVSKLASESKNKEVQNRAIEIIKGWSKDPEYAKRHSVESFDLIDNIFRLLNNSKTFDDGAEILREFVTSDNFIKKNDSWRTWDVAKALAKVLEDDFEKGLEILKQTDSSERLTLNQQTLICSGLQDISNDRILKEAYDEFLRPTLERLDNNIQKIEERFSNRYSRESLVQFGEKLALGGFYDEALDLIKIFIDDSDPILESYPDDKEESFNYHEKIKSGEDDSSIGTVRGWCAWVIQKLAVPRDFSKIDKTRDVIKRLLPLLKKLATDPNYYVRVQATIPLIDLAKNRHTVLPENKKERFVSPAIAKEIENIAFLMLRDKTNHKLPAVMKHLAMVLTGMRSVSQDKAMEILRILAQDKYPKKDKQRGRETYLADVLSEAAPLYIFFAEFRTKSFKDWPKEWGDMSKFDDKPFKKLLIELLRKGSPGVKTALAWQFVRLPDEISKTPKSQMTVEEAVRLAASYLEILTSEYDHDVFNNIYRFIEDYIDIYFDDCFNLWTNCIKTESNFFKENFTKDKLIEMYWWPFHDNGKILLAIAKHKGDAEFLKWLEILVDYPIEMQIGYDIGEAVNYLIELKEPKDKVEKIFDRLMERSSNFYESKQAWSKNLKKTKS